MEADSSSLRFVALESVLDGGFWHQLSNNKLNVYKLDEKPVLMKAYYENGYADGLPCRVSVDFTALEPQTTLNSRCFPLHGNLLLTNTLEKFRDCDKQDLIDTAGKSIVDDICKGNVFHDPTLLNKILLLAYADLKQHLYYYWFAFPALSPADLPILDSAPASIETIFTPEQISIYLQKYDTFRNANPSLPIFAATVGSTEDTIHLFPFKEYDPAMQDSVLCFCDPSTHPQYPGWPLRNLLVAVASKLTSSCTVRVLCYRERIKEGVRLCGHSLVLNVTLAPCTDLSKLHCVGWEKNPKGKLLPRIVNLKSSMDPIKLAESAADLNLKLMRWRLMPDLDLESIAKTRCLLLGSGTLGCNVARQLLAWGIHNITLVDNGRVSYSNPVRQSLFNFSDTLDGGKHKAEAASDALKAIFPSISSTPVSLSIPMPGHSISEAEKERVRSDCLQLDHLVAAHDVIYLLLDTREARWLPTLLGLVHQKLVINAALGFDTYLVMRHGFAANGISPGNAAIQSQQCIDASTSHSYLTARIPGTELGCYFCNDVVGPANSTRDRSLDQQCTVTRPGVSMIAAAMAVELMVSLIQHRDGPAAEADQSNEYGESGGSALGIVPHQIRGYLSRFTEVIPSTRAFSQCTGCSQLVLDAYKRDGFDFLFRVFNESDFLEDLTGLKKLQEDTNIDEVIAFSDDDMSM